MTHLRTSVCCSLTTPLHLAWVRGYFKISDTLTISNLTFPGARFAFQEVEKVFKASVSLSILDRGILVHRGKSFSTKYEQNCQNTSTPYTPITIGRAMYR